MAEVCWMHFSKNPPPPLAIQRTKRHPVTRSLGLKILCRCFIQSFCLSRWRWPTHTYSSYLRKESDLQPFFLSSSNWHQHLAPTDSDRHLTVATCGFLFAKRVPPWSWKPSWTFKEVAVQRSHRDGGVMSQFQSGHNVKTIMANELLVGQFKGLQQKKNREHRSTRLKSRSSEVLES